MYFALAFCASFLQACPNPQKAKPLGAENFRTTVAEAGAVVVRCRRADPNDPAQTSHYSMLGGQDLHANLALDVENGIVGGEKSQIRGHRRAVAVAAQRVTVQRHGWAVYLINSSETLLSLR